MCRLRNIALRDYQESVTTGQTDTHANGQKDAGQSDPYVPLCFTGDTKNQFNLLDLLSRVDLNSRSVLGY